MLALDGRFLSLLTQRTHPGLFHLSGKHLEGIPIYLIPSSDPIVLDLPWFRLRNPRIDWTTWTVSNRSVKQVVQDAQGNQPF